MINIVGSLRIEVPGTKVWSEQECKALREAKQLLTERLGE